MRYRLTDRDIKKLSSPDTGNRLFFDTEVKELALRVTAAGTRAFVLCYRVHGRERRYTIGEFPTWSTTAAREEARLLLREVDLGHDPLAGRRADREAPTITDLALRFKAEYLPRKRESTRKHYGALIDKEILPRLGRLKVADVTHTDVDRLHRAMTARGASYQANRTVAVLSRMLSLAIKWQYRPDNPAKGIERNQEEKRTRYLSAPELVRLSEALAKHSNRQSANAVRLLLLTGARKGEVLSMRWADLDLQSGVWVKPSAHTKQKKEHRVPLSAPAMALLTGMKDSASSAYVFPGDTAEAYQKDIKRFWSTVCKWAAIDDARIHDVRHTYASILASSGASLPLIGALLGHTQPGTTARYTHLYDDPLRTATERVGAILGAEAKAEVVDLSHARRKP